MITPSATAPEITGALQADLPHHRPGQHVGPVAGKFIAERYKDKTTWYCTTSSSTAKASPPR